MAVVTALRHWGIEEKSVTIMRAGGISERLAALQSRLIDATVLIPPETRRARKLGIPILLELTDLFSYAMITIRIVSGVDRGSSGPRTVNAHP